MGEKQKNILPGVVANHFSPLNVQGENKMLPGFSTCYFLEKGYYI